MVASGGGGRGGACAPFAPPLGPALESDYDLVKVTFLVRLKKRL